MVTSLYAQKAAIVNAHARSCGLNLRQEKKRLKKWVKVMRECEAERLDGGVFIWNGVGVWGVYFRP